MSDLNKKNIMAAILSAAVCPGLGQMVKGEAVKGVAIMVALGFGLFVTVVEFMLYFPLGVVLALCLLGGYLWNVYDAFQR